MTTAAAVTPVGQKDGRIRVVIESITPSIDGGRFAAKRVVGDEVVVEADCFADGHDVVACDLLWRKGPGWRRTPMRALGNDRWRAGFEVDAIGTWHYTVCARVDPFLSWRHDFERRIDLADVRVAALTGARLIEAAAQRAPRGDERKRLTAWSRQIVAALDADATLQALREIALDASAAQIAGRHPRPQP